MNSQRNAWNSNGDPRKLFARSGDSQAKASRGYSSLASRLQMTSSAGSSGGISNNRKVSGSYRPRASTSTFVPSYGTKANGYTTCISVGSSSANAYGSSSSNSPTYESNSTAGTPGINKVKTEMCNTVKQGKICHFGDRCKYAHHQSELQLTTMRARIEAGTILDGKIYRSRPCFDFTSTGSCPFGERCTALHDERIKGAKDAWVKHCRYYQESVPTEVHVDYNCYGKTSEIHYGDSLGSQTQDMFKSFESFSNYASNKIPRDLLFGPTAIYRNQHWNNKESLTTSQRLHIACKMSENCADSRPDFKYKPSHIVCNNVCMIVQERAFSKAAGSHLMEEVPMPRANSSTNHRQPRGHRSPSVKTVSSPKIYVVREIVFGHPSSTDDAQHPPALWINTPEDVMIKADLATIKKNSKNKERGRERCLMRKHDEPPFRLFYSSNTDVQQLIGDVLRHQFRLSFFHDNDILKEETKVLKTKFAALVKVLKASHWPVNKGRNVDDLDIPLPPVNGQYCVDVTTKNDRHLGRLWDSAISNVGDDKRSFTSTTSNTDRPKRLSIFRDLGVGYSTPSKSQSIPPLVSMSEDEDSKEPLPKDIIKGWEIVRDLYEQGHKGIRLEKK